MVTNKKIKVVDDVIEVPAKSILQQMVWSLSTVMQLIYIKHS